MNEGQNKSCDLPVLVSLDFSNSQLQFLIFFLPRISSFLSHTQKQKKPPTFPFGNVKSPVDDLAALSSPSYHLYLIFQLFAYIQIEISTIGKIALNLSNKTINSVYRQSPLQATTEALPTRRQQSHRIAHFAHQSRASTLRRTVQIHTLYVFSHTHPM